MSRRFSVERVQEQLTTRFLGRKMYYEETVDSTNLRIRELAKAQAPAGTLYGAEVQTAGRGRRGRSWHTPAGEALAMSFLLYPDCAPDRASMLSLVAGLGVAQGCQELGIPVQVKWPNDVVLSGKKLCGILTEMQADPEKIHFVVVGIGINVNLKEIPEELQQVATSLYQETGREWERETVMACALNHIEKNYEIFQQTADLSGLQKEYESFLVNCGRQVRIEAGKDSFTGTAMGINPMGELLVKREDGSVCPVCAGEVSVRGLYGYV